MKVLYSLCCFVCAMLYNNAAQAYFSPYHTGTPPIEKTETKPNAEPKLSSAGYIKYAAVNFISKRSGITSDASGDDLDSMPIKETSCPTGQTKVDGICIDVAACNTSFPLSSVSSKIGSYVTKNCGSGNRYCYTSCQTGWTHSGCNCTANDCAGFPLSTSGNNCNGVKSCKTGDSYKYKCTGCATGYTLTDAGICVSTKCSSYGAGYLDASTAHCKKNDIKRNGEQHCYKCTECEDGWVLGSDFACSAKPCSDYGATYSSSQTPNCVAHETKKSGDNFCYRCSACGEGWKLNTSTYKCEAKGCSTGYSATQTANCKTLATEKNGGSYCYKCSACNEGWTLKDGACVAKGCSTGYTSTMTNNCKTPSTEKNGDSYCYKCSACNEGWKLNNNACVAKGCSSGYSSTLTANCKTPSTEKNGDSYCYKCSACNEGWTLKDGACVAKGCSTGYSATQTANCKTLVTEKNGDSYCYKCSECNEGWKLSNNACVAKGCSSSTSQIANCTAYSELYKNGDGYCYKCKTCEGGYTLNTAGTACTAISCASTKSQISNCTSYTAVTRAGGDICYKCSACAAGYTLNSAGTSCTANSCSTGYATGMTNMAHCNNFTSQIAGTNICHTCTSCDSSGYRVVSGQCKAYTCTDHGSLYKTSQSVPNCKTYDEKLAGDSKCYKCTACDNGWTLSGSSCGANSCTGYALSSCPTGGTCSNCKSGASYKYTLNSCQDGYTKSGSACNPNSCSGYTLSSCPTGGNCSNCKSGTSYKYTLNSCQSGYTKSGSTSCIKCNAGYIYYSDNTCSSTYYSTKTVVGVVGGNGFIVYYQHQGCRTWTSAKSTCSGITKGGKTARLPTKDEAEQMRDNYSSIVAALRKISGASDNLGGNTWTSTETASDKVWYVNIEEKQTGIDYKAKDCDNTRCVFSF